MSDPELLAREAGRWLRFAAEDLDATQCMLADRSAAARSVCWHSQQAAERALKAALVHEEIDSPFIHDLNALCNLLPDCPGRDCRHYGQVSQASSSLAEPKRR